MFLTLGIYTTEGIKNNNAIARFILHRLSGPLAKPAQFLTLVFNLKQKKIIMIWEGRFQSSLAIKIIKVKVAGGVCFHAFLHPVSCSRVGTSQLRVCHVVDDYSRW